MSFEILEQLEAKVQMAVDTISLLQMEIEDLKEQNESLTTESHQLKSSRVELEQKNEEVLKEQQAWQDRIRGLLGKMEDVE
ncbi:MAG: cell division protein ZapB [Aliivibrio sp.]|uniref:cell division protein ZapB n=1 Tax=Aliivibrio sp. TaxID=1872443 RepID=UPI001A5706B3|nr:cell division protein ZapB [Aliivibrio sp.]